MENNEAGRSKVDAFNIIQLISDWKKTLIVISLLSFVGAYIFTLPTFIKPKYKSFAIVYPSNLQVYSVESSTEQLQQLYNSSDIREQLVKDFNLYQHYGIDSTEKGSKALMTYELNSNIDVSKTQFESVLLEVTDISPDTAKAMCDSIIAKANTLARQLQRAKSFEVYKLVKWQFDNKSRELDSLDNALQEIRINQGIFSFAEQSRELSKAYYAAVAQGKAGNGHTKLDEMYKNFQEYGGKYVTLNEHLNRVRTVYNEYKSYYENALRDISKELTYSNVVTHPVVADKKSYPIRWLITLMFITATLFVSIILIAVYENYSKHK